MGDETENPADDWLLQGSLEEEDTVVVVFYIWGREKRERDGDFHCWRDVDRF